MFWGFNLKIELKSKTTQSRLIWSCSWMVRYDKRKRRIKPNDQKRRERNSYFYFAAPSSIKFSKARKKFTLGAGGGGVAEVFCIYKNTKNTFLTWFLMDILSARDYFLSTKNFQIFFLYLSPLESRSRRLEEKNFPLCSASTACTYPRETRRFISGPLDVVDVVRERPKL